jgi:hypothetical protein
MSVYVDDAAILFKGKLRFHMCADSLQELHDFALKMNIKRCWYHPVKSHPHYDITEEQRHHIIQHGALAISQKELLFVAKKLAQALKAN